jgi:hypothetical protein
MAPARLQALHNFFSRFACHPSLTTPSEQWQQITKTGQDISHSPLLIALIDSATLFLEREMQSRAYPEELLELHRQLFLEMESLWSHNP